MPTEPLSKTYRPEEHEQRVWQRWVASRAFAADPARVVFAGARPYTILIPPPNVTAALHLGHALNNSLQDVLARVHRMKGFETLWMPGTDHAGIATQTVVEKRVLAEEGKRRTDFKRDDFVARIQAFKDEYERRITEQLMALGCSCDWDRQRFTMDAVCARAVREAFFRLFRDGLIYRGKRLVNWDPVTQTALADDEVEMEEVDGAFYYLRYPLVHPSTNASDPKDAQEVTWSELAARGYPGAESMPEDDPAWVTVATTRPETYLGDTAVALHPKDPRAAALRGLKVQLPLVGRIIPLVTDDYVVMPVWFPWEEPSDDAMDDDRRERSTDAKSGFATGFLKVTPAHDPNDYDIGRRHDLELINVMAPDASISQSHGWEREARGEGGHIFVGLSREEARKLVVREFQARGLLEQVRPYTHSVGHSYRSHAPVEPYLSDQWYVRVSDDRLRGQAQRAMVRTQRTEQSLAAWPESVPDIMPVGSTDESLTFFPARYARTYETWHDNLRDWCISRQLWWGHRIPVWSREFAVESQSLLGAARSGLDIGRFASTIGSACDDGLAAIMLEGRDTTVDAVEIVNAIAAGVDPVRVFVCVAPGQEQLEDALNSFGFVQEDDVLDTWFSSALWPLSTLGWPSHDLPIVMPHQIDPANFKSVRTVMIKRVGEWSEFIGQDGEPSAEVVERLLHLRDGGVKVDGQPVLSYQLFSEADLRESGYKAQPLTRADDITDASDLVCAVALRTTSAIDSQRFGRFDLRAWLASHGFVDTAGLLDAFNPTNVLCTAREIITLWVSRMVMFNRYFLGDRGGPSPFHDVFIHAMIQDGEGRKMSKSLGNGVDPLDIIHSHGADALRFTLVQMTTQTQDVRMPVERDEATGRNTSPKFDLGRNFCNKLWNAARFAMSNLEGAAAASAVSPDSLALVDRWMLSRVAEAARSIDDALQTYQFSTYAQSMYDLIWRDFCDWYLEAIKPTVRTSPSQQACLRQVLDAMLRMVHPITPFITETIFERLREFSCGAIEGLDLGAHAEGALLATSAWPMIGSDLLDPDATRSFERVRSLVTSVREVRAQHQVAPKRRIRLHVDAALAAEIAAAGSLVETLAGVEVVTTEAPASGSVALTFDARDLSLSDLADAVDAGAERERLTRQQADLEKSVQALTSRLANPGYADRAPAHLVQQTRDQLARAQADLDAVIKSLARLG